MKIAIMSDSHDNWENLEKAVVMANDMGCEVLLHAGDLIAPPGIGFLKEFKGDVKFIWGNNEMERVGITRQMDAIENIEMCGDVFEGEISGVRVFMNHYPRYAELAAASGEFDLCIHGHTHEYREEKVGETLLINPGEIQGWRTGKATFVVFDAESGEVEKFELGRRGDEV